jgi:hypothetical protein
MPGRQRLGIEHIERRTANASALQRRDQLGLDDGRAAADVDDDQPRAS